MEQALDPLGTVAYERASMWTQLINRAAEIEDHDPAHKDLIRAAPLRTVSTALAMEELDTTRVVPVAQPREKRGEFGMMDGIWEPERSEEQSEKRLHDGAPLRRLSLALGMALTLALAGIGQAQQTGKLVGMPLPDKHTSAILFASRDVSNLDRSERFYSEVLRLKRVGGYDYDDGSAREVFLAFDEKPETVKIALQWKKASDSEPLPKTDGINRIVIQVTDIKEVRERAVAFGGKTAGELHKVDDVWMGGIVDPDGHRISLIQQE